jgi:hypothetical protein
VGFTIKHGDLSAIAQLGALAGKAQKRQREEAMAFEAAMQMQEIRSRIKMARFRAQLGQESEKRQMAFELQKMQIAKQNTFAMQEELRMQKMQDEADKRKRDEQKSEALHQAIDDDDRLSEEEKSRLHFNVQSRTAFGAGAPQMAVPKVPAATDPMKMKRGLEDDMLYFQDIINSYSENQDLPGWGGGVAPLAKYDKDKEEWVAASDQERQIYEYAKEQAGANLQQLKMMTGQPQGADPLSLLGPGGEATTVVPRPTMPDFPGEDLFTPSRLDRPTLPTKPVDFPRYGRHF